MHRLYDNEDLVVFWNSEKCFHAKKCVTVSPKTFDINKKPWINLEGADNKEVWQAIEKCPSGALKCLYRHNDDIRYEPEKCRTAAYDGGKMIGECDYEESDGGWNIYHTEVLPEYEGKGIAKRLVYKLIEESERNKTILLASCWYARKVISE